MDTIILLPPRNIMRSEFKSGQTEFNCRWNDFLFTLEQIAFRQNGNMHLQRTQIRSTESIFTGKQKK